MKDKINGARILIIIVLIAVAIAALFLPVKKTEAAEKKYTYNFIYIKDKVKYEMTYSSDEPCILFKRHGGTGLRGMRLTYGSFDSADAIKMYKLKSDSSWYEQVYPIVEKKWNWNASSEQFELDESYETGSMTLDNLGGVFCISTGYVDLCNSNIRILAVNTSRNSDTIINQYLQTGKVPAESKDDTYVLSGTSLFTKYCLGNGGIQYNDSNLEIKNVQIDDNGLITYDVPAIPQDAIDSGVTLATSTTIRANYVFDFPLRLGSAIQTHFNSVSFPYFPHFNQVYLEPYYVSKDGIVHLGKWATVGIDYNADYFTKEDNNERLFTITTKSLTPEVVDPNGDEEFSHGGGGRRDNGDKFFDGKSTIISGEKREVKEVTERNDFYLKDVKVSSGIGNFSKTIKWNGTSIDGTLASIPASDSTVIITYAMYDEDLNYKIYTLDTVNINKGKYTLNYNDFINEVYASPYTWDGEIRLCPVYYLEANKHLYMGRQTVVDLLHGGIDEEYEDDSGNFKQDTIRKDNDDSSDVGESSTSESGDGIWGSISDFIQNIGSLNGFVGVFFGLLQDLIGMMGSFPSLLASVVGFIPSVYLNAIGSFLLIVLFLRLLGR